MFFSLLAPLILIVLYAVVLGALQVDYLTDALPAANPADILWFVNSWVFAGITMITTLTTALAALSTYVEDRTSGRFQDFRVSPLRQWQMILGYLLASFLISVVMSLGTAVVGQLYMTIRGEAVMSALQMAKTTGWVVLSSVTFAAMASFAVTFLKSSGAFAALSTIVGTLSGFLAGAYIPAGALPTGVVSVLNVLPFAQSAMLIRGPMTQKALDALTVGAGQEQALATLEPFYGISASVGDLQITTPVAAFALAGVTVAFTALSVWRLSRTIR